MSNFSFLQSEWGGLHEAAHRAERAVHSDPRAACFYARRCLELATAWLYAHDKAFKQPYQDTLSAFIFEPSFRAQVGDALFTKTKLIKDLGNLAVHGNRKMLETDALSATRELFHFCYWVARNYGRTARPAPGLTFAPGLIPKASDTPALTQAQLQKLSDELADRNEALTTLRNEKAELNAELQRLRAEVAAAKKANALEPDTHDYSEAETRKTYIDLLLREAGWTLDPAKNFEIEVTGMPNNEGKGYVDYVLWGDDGKPLMLVEAKRTTRDSRVGQQQAKLYADCLEQAHGQRPIIFYSNGYEHWLWDDKSYPPRAVQGFYKKQELELLIQRRSSRKKLAEAVINPAIIERYYQTRAVRRVGETLEVDNQRKSLLVMATGSGKTRTVIALADVLMRSNWAKRVLFLADRVALVNQAVNAFKIHLPDAAPVNLVTEKNTEGRVYVSTYPTMMGLIDEAQDGQRRFGVGHFDLIVIDEAHRSVYQKYRAIFNYFDSLLVGLTATPKDEIDKNTYGLFDLESGVPTDAYTLEQAIADGHLVEPIPVSVPMKFQREGIKYSDLSDDEKEQWDALDWNDEGTAPTEVDPAELNQWLFNADTVDKVLELLMTKGHTVAGGDRLGKTIIFAKNNAHAEFIADRFSINYPQYKGNFARVVTYKTEYAQSLIDDFSKRDKMPHIAISVDMLDTGIDVPEVVNLVFFKMVRSKTKFWQMVGRGTRLCKDLFGPGEDKQNFYIFDFCGNLEFFSQNPEFAEGGSTEPLSTRLFKTRLQVILELDRKLPQLPSVAENDPPPYGDNLTDGQLRRDLANMLREKVVAMNVDNFVVRPQRRYVEKFVNAEAWQKLGPDEVEELNTKVADLPSAITDEDEEAKRFDMLVLRAQLAILQAKPDFASLREKIQRIAIELEAQIAIPAIKAEIVLIQAIASDEWWEGATVPMLETVRRRLRALIKLIPKGQKKIVYTDFEDELGESSVIDLPQVTAGLNMSKFREKARAFLKAHESHLSLQRLRRNQPLTQTDLDELEKMLLEAGGTPVLISEAKEQCHGLGLFVRSLVGLDREAAMQAFAEFIRGTTASPNQIEFVNLIVEELTQTGSVEPRRLFESPFTDVNAQGPLGVFHSAQVSQIVQVLEDIRHRAVA
ncbi:DEAD/DEAH box helicase family protein [Ralstonia solanacearum]|uniref:DEAD/DEAH box helicase family protein n=1 Tax=Ralstonia solanacearum TaxID=305 RepID=A0AAE3NLH9_RALSL|nr:DEAD/DEAH box helicase family protein [Ralstonia solanacearum]MBB6580351.1 DEAD/DEAH box helicase family protein [Ralstonia solanacearum]MDB0523084.1 DEAD/DEAH box helicase family protein [Ralstonia solanacearum]